MKLVSKNTLLAALLAAASCGAFAADSVDLKVIGTIIPPSCTPTLSGGGIIDFGNIPAGSLSSTAFTVLPTKSTTLTVTCDAAVKVAVGTTDNRASSVVAGTGAAMGLGSESYNYGLGAVGGKNVGSYVISTSGAGAATADGANVDDIQSVDGNVTWAAAGTGMQTPGVSTFSWAPAGTTVPGAYATITQPLQIRAALNKKTDLPDLSQQVPLDGLATFTLTYL